MISKHALGRLNVVDRPIINKVVHLNTKFRDNYYNTSSADFFYKFPLIIRNAISVRIHSVDIPNTRYVFSNQLGNNTFIIEIIVEGTCRAVVYKIEIPEGNYNAEQLEHYLNYTYFYKSEQVDELNYIKFSINRNNLKSKFEMVNSPSYRIKFNIKFVLPLTKSIIFTMGWILGFRMAQYLNIETDIISEGLFDGGGDRYIYLSLEDYNTSRNDNNRIALDNNFLDKNILGKIYLRDGLFHINIDDNDNKCNLKQRTFNGPVNFDRIHIKLYDEYGNIVHLNNMDYSVALEFEILYENWCY